MFDRRSDTSRPVVQADEVVEFSLGVRERAGKIDVTGSRPCARADRKRIRMPLKGKENPYLRFDKNRRKTDSLWDRYQCSHGSELVDALDDPYERLILEEWERCRRLGVNPGLHEARVLTEEELCCLTTNKSFLLGRAMGVLGRVQDVLEGIPGVLILTDENGTILHIMGDPKTRIRAADQSNLIEGGQWGEEHAGINGIGTAIARRSPVHVYASEHFCEGWHTWSCAGSPVLSPFGQDVLGAVDFTTDHSDYRRESLALVHSLASSIGGELRVQVEMERLQLIHQYSIWSARFPSDAVLVFDRLGSLVRATPGTMPEPAGEADTDLTFLSEVPKEVHSVFAPGDDQPIGKVIVVSRSAMGSRPHASASHRPPPVAAFGDFITVSDQVKGVIQRIGKVAPTDLSILLIGETGTGKELIASHIHALSSRRSGPFVAVNCGAISKELFESKFFGYERGGFTGADPKGRRGLFESAQNGTLFLDEIGELPLDMQAGLLRVLETGVFRRIGSDRERTTNCRVVAATNCPLLEAVERGEFRSDLYYRLSVMKALIPPLRERREDVPVLVAHITGAVCTKYGIPTKVYSAEAMGILAEHDWPGNVRELRNVIEATVVCSDQVIVPSDLPGELFRSRSATVAEVEQGGDQTPAPGLPPTAELNIREQQRRLILSALKKYKKISLVAAALGISRSTLYRRFEELEIDHKAVIASSRVSRPS